MSRNRASAKAAGTRFERHIADYLNQVQPSHGRTRSAPGSAGHTHRGLTRSLDLGKEGLMPQRTRTPYHSRTCIHCGRDAPPQKMGQPRKYCSDECRANHYRDSRRRPVAKRSVRDRLQDKLHRNDTTGCLEFAGYRNEHGYGVIRDGDGRTALAHRVAWSIENGAIPDGMHVCHTCDNPPCCDPEHLFLGSHAENMADRDRKGRTLRGDALRKVRWGR